MKWIFCIAAFGGAVLAQAPPPGSGPVDIHGFVRVIEADTFEIWIKGAQTGVGLIGVRAPMGNTECGQEAIRFVQNLLRGGVHLDEDPSITFDARKRRMYYAVNPADKSSVQLALVSAGYAHADGTGKEAAALAAAEASASANARGCIFRPAALSPVPTRSVQSERDVRDGALLSEENTATPAAPQTDETAKPKTTLIPSGFTQQTVASGLTNPTDMAFLPDGRILVAQKHGTVLVYKNGTLLPTPFIDISGEVNDYWDHGLLGIAVDPNFATNNNVYLLYTYENDPNQYNGTKTARLTRVTAVGDTASPTTEQVILGTITGASCDNFPAGTDCISSDAPSHSIGSIKFASDGTMFLSVGDGASFNVVDPEALRAQNLDLLTGKVLHITSSGAGVSTNPFWTGSAGANRSKVWGYGLRNPFRLNPRPSANAVYIGDVGWSTWEEINATASGGNFGWPCYEGSAQQSGYATYSQCQSLYAQGTSAVVMPLVSWNHNGAGAAAVGGVFYTGTSYPSQFQGAYFYGDYALNVIRYITTDASNNITGGPTDFATSADGPVDIEMGPDGNLYYVAISSGELRKIVFSSGNTPPTAVASANPTAGLAPLAVQFSSAGSSDTDGDTLTYSWNFGDGSAAATVPNPQHTYSVNGKYAATLTVNDGHGNTATASVVITVGNRPPTPQITAPSPTLTYKVGDVINFSGTAMDPEDGAIGGAGLAWQVIIHHCPGGVCHTHPFLSTTGASGSFTVPDHGDQSYFEIILTATDSGGLQTSTSVQVQPQTVQITIATSPSGLQVGYSGESGPSPFTRTTIVGSVRTISVASPQSSLGASYTFTNWSDGGALQHNVTIGTSNVTYTASFTTAATALRVNSGGPSYTDTQTQQVWQADTNFSGGNTYVSGGSTGTQSVTVTNTTNPTLYRSERYGTSFQYQFAVQNGTYSVNLKFAEIYFTTTGQRVFNVAINGQTVLSNFDIVQAAGGPDIAVDKAFPVSVTGGQITIQFTAVVENAKISAIEISPATGISVAVSPKTATLSASQSQQFSAAVSGTSNTAVTWSVAPQVGTISSSGLYQAPATITASQTVTVTATSAADTSKSDSATVTLTSSGSSGGTFTPIRVNTGDSSYTDPSGQVWAADTGSSGAIGTYTTSHSISGTTTPVLYQSERYGSNFQYQFAVPNGNYAVTLKFAEIYFTQPGQRVFNVAINGQNVLSNFDIVQLAGANTAIDRTFNVSANAGQIAIQFTASVDNAKIDAIQIVSGSAVGVSVSPGTASLGPSQTQQFTANVTGTTNTSVTWSLSPQAGTISSSGLYQAPATITANQTVTVTATSAADTSASGSATVTLTSSGATFTPIRVNSGGSSYTDPSNQVWAADTGSSGAIGTYTTSQSISGTTTPVLYQSERYGATFQYQFAVPNGNYAVTLKFAEIYFTQPGQRVFNVAINGQNVLSNFDIVQLAGANAAIDRTFNVSANTGQIAIQFTASVNNAKISAIQIVSAP